MVGQATWDPAVGRRYTSVAIFLHWTIALMIAYNLLSGLGRPLLPRAFFVFHVSSGITILALTIVRIVWRLTHRPPPLLPMPKWQKRLATTVHYLLYAAMLALPFSGWAMVSANPPIGSPGADYAAAQHAARAANGQPAVALTPGKAAGGPAGAGQGGGMAPKRPGPLMVWGLFKLPLIGPLQEIGRLPAGVAAQHEKHEQIETVHLLGGWVMLALLMLHIGGALKHQFGDRMPELQRMGLGRRRMV